jgi:GTPase SAR1 family protein
MEDIVFQMRTWDISGDPKHSTFAGLFYWDAHLCFVTVDVTSKKSFDTAKRYLREIVHKKHSPILIIVVATKSTFNNEDHVFR